MDGKEGGIGMPPLFGHGEAEDNPMGRQEVFAWVKQQYGTEPDYPWQDGNAVLRHKRNRKWYGLVMEVGREKLGLTGYGTAEVINLKCNPDLIGSLRERPGFHPAYHMNKEHWLSLVQI